MPKKVFSPSSKNALHALLESRLVKIALLSDIHANVQALHACMAHAKTQGIDRWALLGDLVGYGGNPKEVVDIAMHLAEGGAWVIQGNHDAMAVMPPIGDESLGGSTAQWTSAQLSASQRNFLKTLPLTILSGPLLLVHASAHAPDRWHYVDSERAADLCVDHALQNFDARHVVVGHVHHQTIYYRGTGHSMMRFEPTAGVPIPMPLHRRWVATVGSVGQPRDHKPEAMYAVYDDVTGRLTFQRVAYDHEGAATAIRKAGLAEFFAERLAHGR
jgi:diadenosine tetraphosphatase ApaH/serine/threonine PP2A family protein phosphatase